MKYYVKLLTLGQHLSSERQFELYEFLKQENSKIYQNLLEVLRVKKLLIARLRMPRSNLNLRMVLSVIMSVRKMVSI